VIKGTAVQPNIVPTQQPHLQRSFIMSLPNFRTWQQRKFWLALVLTLSLVTVPLIPSSRSMSANASLAGTASLVGQAPDAITSEPATGAAARAQEAYGKVGMSFEANQGQTEDEVKFLARGAGYTLFLTSTEAVFVLAREDAANARASGYADPRSGNDPNSSRRPVPSSPDSTPPAVLRMKLAGANSRPAVLGLEELEGKVNYFIGNDAAKWHTDIPTFGRVHYASVYDGVDLVYYGNQQQLEYDFVVRPGANYNHIALGFEGASKVQVDAASGDLLLQVGETTLRQQKPMVYQEVNGERKEIESGYMLKGAGSVGFDVGAYDRGKPLVIDPVLVYSTYLGGGGLDIASSIEVDSAGNAYITGTTFSTNFPTANPIQGAKGATEDAFVTKLNAAGSSLVYSTYLGGNQSDGGSGIAVDSAGNAYVTGYTGSTNFPTANAIQGAKGGDLDAFVTKLNTTGSALVYSTYLGGGAGDLGNGIAIDSAGNAYVTGETASINFPIANAIQATYGGNPFDAFVTKLNAAGSALVYSTYLGGENVDDGLDIAVDSASNAYVTGFTRSNSFPVANAIQGTTGSGNDAFVTKLNAAGSAFDYSTYLGGTGADGGRGIAVDSAGNAYITGDTTSINFPTANAIQGVNSGQDAFVTKLSAAGSALVYSTYLGGTAADSGSKIAVDSTGNAYIIGNTASINFPTVNPIQGSNGGGAFDAFVTTLNTSDSAVLFSTYLGGGNTEDSNAIALDSAGNTYVTGATLSVNFPLANPIQGSKSGDRDAFIAKIGSFAISGRVIDPGGNGIAGVTVTLSGSNSDITMTDTGGNFAFLKTSPGGNFTVTPTETGFTFSPPSININELGTNQALIFVGTVTGATPTPTPTPAQTRVHFEFDQYVAAEDCGGLSVAVVRTGDTTGPLTVDFATSDGTAKQKGDYTITLGTLNFAPGDTRKIITLLITEDAFVEGDETFNLNLFNLSGPATLEEPSRATITIADDDTTPTNTNPIDDTHTFVCQHYHDFFNREPDTSGLLFWTNNIESCGANASCREAKRIDTSAAFFLSIEFQATGFYAIRMQRAAFGKRSDTATTRMTYQDLIRDTQQLDDGVIVGEAGADAKLEQNKQAYATQVVTSAAFIARFPTSQTAAEYVDALYASAQVTPSATERADAISAFGGGGTSGRVAALRKIAESQSLINAEFSPAFVLLQYHGYLRRNPTDLPDADDSGYQFWLTKLTSFAGDFRKAEMVKAFLSSAEYRQRFGQP
jgi:hypothetical protein